MKNPARIFAITFFMCILTISCAKKNNYYSIGVDNTTGMITGRIWSGNTAGYTKGDTLIPPDTAHIPCPKSFGHNIIDTSFSIVKINAYLVSVLGTRLNYRFTDSVAKKIVFDTIFSGSSRTTLVYYFAVDSMTYDYHRVDSLNARTGIYYYTDEFLHTK